jgi:hypothetical protein
MQRSLTGVYAVAIPLKQKSRQMDSRFDPYMICWSSADCIDKQRHQLD